MHSDPITEYIRTLPEGRLITVKRMRRELCDMGVDVTFQAIMHRVLESDRLEVWDRKRRRIVYRVVSPPAEEVGA